MENQPHQKRGIPDDGDFDELLRSAKVEVPLPGAFQYEVWRRIAVAQESTLRARLARMLEPMLGLLSRPLAASASMVLMIFAGLWLGSLGDHPSRDAKLAYIESVSPFAQSHRGGSR